MLCLCTPNQHSVHQQFLVLERTCRFHCCFCFTLCLHSLSLIRDTVERILCNDYPFQNLISHFTRFLFALVFVLNRDGFFIRKHSVFVFFSVCLSLSKFIHATSRFKCLRLQSHVRHVQQVPHISICMEIVSFEQMCAIFVNICK